MGFAALNRGAVNVAPAPPSTACEIYVCRRAKAGRIRSQIPELLSSHFLAMAYQTERVTWDKTAKTA
jgi:hypothetical protein